MMGRHHVTVGACMVGVAGAAHWLPWSQPKLAVVVGSLIIAGSVVPDIDHKKSQITRSWGPLTWLLCRFWRIMSRWVYVLTRTPDDPKKRDPHRTFTHTWVAAIMFGGLTGAAMANHIAATATVGLLCGAAGRSYHRDYQLPSSVATGAVMWSLWPSLGGQWPAVCVAVAIGCLIHDFSDCTTKAGNPLQFPRVMRVQVTSAKTGSVTEKNLRWHMSGPPAWMRYETGGAIEFWVVRLILCMSITLMTWLIHVLPAIHLGTSG